MNSVLNSSGGLENVPERRSGIIKGTVAIHPMGLQQAETLPDSIRESHGELFSGQTAAFEKLLSKANQEFDSIKRSQSLSQSGKLEALAKLESDTGAEINLLTTRRRESLEIQHRDALNALPSEIPRPNPADHAELAEIRARLLAKRDIDRLAFIQGAARSANLKICQAAAYDPMQEVIPPHAIDGIKTAYLRGAHSNAFAKTENLELAIQLYNGNASSAVLYLRQLRSGNYVAQRGASAI